MKYFLLIFSLLFYCSTSLAMPPAMFMLGGSVTDSAGGACTEEVSFGAAGTNSNNVASIDSTKYYAHQFTAGDWPAITKIQLYTEEIGNVDGQTWTMQLYNDSSDDPGIKITNGSCIYSGTDFGATAYFGCVFAPAITLTNTVSYHVGLNRGGSADSSNYLKVHRERPAGSDAGHKSSDESVWENFTFDDSTIKAKFYSGSECSGN